MEVRLVIVHEGHEAVAEMQVEDGYPLMSLVSVDGAT